MPCRAVPTSYHPWLTRAGATDLPQDEPRSTCASCAMAAPDPPGLTTAFDAEVACCTYIPTLANHAVGRILRDASAGPGRDSVVARIDAHVAVTPIGLDWPHWAGELYDGEDRGFGVNRALRCPHHQITPDGGRCGIWEHRNAVCATWFCKHDRGETSRAVWMAIRDLLTAIDTRLAWFAIDELGTSAERRELLRPRAGLLRGAMTVDGHPGGEPTAERRRAVWGRWFGREQEFFIACADVIDQSDASTLHQMVHDATKPQRDRLHHRLQALDASVPVAPRTQHPTVLVRGEVDSIVRAYSAYDPLIVPNSLMDNLHHFDGAHIDVVRHRLAQAGVDLDTLDLQHLVDMRVVG